MSISVRDRKLLWGAAAMRCATCRRLLVVDAADADPAAIVGDEAHIIAAGERGPRADAGERIDLDYYENLILLCKVDHKVVDDQPNEYPPARLRRIKAEHEQWVRDALEPALRADAEEAATAAIEHLYQQDLERSRVLTSLNPSSWCSPSDSNGPEVVIRVLVAMPEAFRITPGAPPFKPPRPMRAEAREHLIEKALEASQLSARVRALQPSWHWTGDNGWQTVGPHVGANLTQTQLKLDWPEHFVRPPIGLTCSVLQGATNDTSDPKQVKSGVMVALDLKLNVLELDAQRQPSPVAHRTTTPPAPAALELSELASLLQVMLTFPDTARGIATALLDDPPTHGWLAVWLALSGTEIDRVTKLDGIRRLDGSPIVTRFETHTEWDFDSDSGLVEERLISEFLTEALEQAGYRSFDAVIDNLFS